jgi:hypothetical protein
MKSRRAPSRLVAAGGYACSRATKRWAVVCFPAPEGEEASQEAHVDAVNEGESWLLRFAAPIEGITQ